MSDYETIMKFNPISYLRGLQNTVITDNHSLTYRINRHCMLTRSDCILNGLDDGSIKKRRICVLSTTLKDFKTRGNELLMNQSAWIQLQNYILHSSHTNRGWMHSSYTLKWMSARVHIVQSSPIQYQTCNYNCWNTI